MISGVVVDVTSFGSTLVWSCGFGWGSENWLEGCVGGISAVVRNRWVFGEEEVIGRGILEGVGLAMRVGDWAIMARSPLQLSNSRIGGRWMSRPNLDTSVE